MTWCFQTKPAKEAVSACTTTSSCPWVLQGSLNGTRSDKCLGVILTCGWNLARFNPRRGGWKQTPALLRKTSPTGDKLDGLMCSYYSSEPLHISAVGSTGNSPHTCCCYYTEAKQFFDKCHHQEDSRGWKACREPPAAETLQAVSAQQPQIKVVQQCQSSMCTNPSSEVLAECERKGFWHSWVTPATAS